MQGERLDSLKAAARLRHRNYDNAQLILAAGRRGKGKTTAARFYVENTEPRVFAFDAFNDFRGLKVADVDRALDDMYDNPVACRRRVRPPIGADSYEYAEYIFNEIINAPIRNMLLVLDEITLWSKPRASKALTTLVLQGRRLGIRMFVGCQRISLVPDVILSEVTEMMIFNMKRPRDKDVLAEWTDRETAEIAPNLRKGECICIDD